ncbi:hypothetical protein [uncultured Arcticibacterium sp.]|uniref:tetratricopeptide repeat-containing sensor histidine kinase n=1 Tax=uncultured Arcticibacterium sp. TaxID=2173042 RepID=UPI0030FB4B31
MKLYSLILIGLFLSIAPTNSAQAETGMSRDSLAIAISFLEKQPATIERDTLLMYYYNDLCEKSIYAGDPKADLRLEQFRLAQINSQWPISKALYFRALGKKEDKLGDYQKAIEYYHNALQILEEYSANPEHIVYTKILLGYVMLNSGNQEECIRLFKEAEPLALKLHDTSHAIWILDFFADNTLDKAQKESDYLEALAYYKQAENLLPKSLIKNQIPNNLQGQAKVYHLLGNEKKSEEYLALALEQAQRLSNYFIQYNIYSDYAEKAAKKKEFDKAIDHQLAAVSAANSFGYLEFINRSNQNLYKIYKAAGNEAKALETLEYYVSLEDSLMRQEVNEKYAELEGQYEFEKQQNRIQELENTQLQYVLWTLAAILLLSTLFGIYLVKNSRKLRRQNQLLNDKNEEIRLAIEKGSQQERKRVANDLHDGLATKITAMKWRLEAEKPTELSEFMVSELEKLYTDVRLIAHNMASQEFHIKGLIPSIENLITKLNLIEKTSFKLENKLPASRTFKHDLGYQLYCIILELSTNVMKHSNATMAILSLKEYNANLIISMTDNGSQPKDNTRSGIGLLNMKERVKNFKGSVIIRDEEGFEVFIEIPLS